VICSGVCCRFPVECNSERIFKIGQFLAKYEQEFGVLFLTQCTFCFRCECTLFRAWYVAEDEANGIAKPWQHVLLQFRHAGSNFIT